MNWIASFFSRSNKPSLGRGQAMTTTHEAFSLPTSSPGLTPHTDVYNPDTPRSLGPQNAYPPRSPVSPYSYGPTSSRTRPASLLPLHHAPFTDALTPPPPYPPLAHTWNRLKLWLAHEYPELGDTLNYGILPQDLARIEMQLGYTLPAPVRESYLIVDGQEAESSAGCSDGLFFGLTLLPLEDVLEEWRFWREVDDDPTTGANTRLRQVMQSIPDDWVRREYSLRGWIPLIVDKTGNYVGVDLNPGEGGSVGQVIVFGRDFDTKVVLWRGNGPVGWATWLASFADELESGEGFELGQGNSESEGSEDGIGYENYFHDGAGRGQGDGGGVAGAGGLRLTGEYKGWSPLEAWADRSVKKWQEAGLLGSEPSSGVRSKEYERHGLGVLNLEESSAVVPIPVLQEKGLQDPFASPVEANVTSVRPPLPAISITKPPPPLPIEVPTPGGVVALSSPLDSQRSSADDLEAGRSIGYRESLDKSALSDVSLRPSPSGPVEMPPTPSEAVDDLFEDSVVLEDATSIIPAQTDSRTSAEEKPSPSGPSSVMRSLSEAPMQSTVRLVDEERPSTAVDALPLTGGDENIKVLATVPIPSSSSTESQAKQDETRKTSNMVSRKGERDSSSINGIEGCPKI